MISIFTTILAIGSPSANASDVRRSDLPKAFGGLGHLALTSVVGLTNPRSISLQKNTAVKI
jgi:hypothetical protein